MTRYSGGQRYFGGGGGSVLRRWLRVAALLVLGVVSCVVRVWYTAGTQIARMDPYSNPVAPSQDPRVRFLSYALVHGMYARLLVWPTFLCYDYSMDAVPLVTSAADVRLLLPVVSYLGLLMAGSAALARLRSGSGPRGAWKRLQAEGVVLGLAVFVLSFLPMTNMLFPIGTLVAERLLYIPSLGVLAAVVSFAQLAVQDRRAASIAAWAALLLTVAFWWVLCYRRVMDWRTVHQITLVDGLKQLRSTRTQFNLANMYMMEQRLDEALVAYQRANSLDPEERDAMPLYHAGQILMYRGQYNEAEQYLHKAVSGYFSPLVLHEEEVWHDYALALWHTGRGAEAAQNFQNAILTNPTFPKGYNNLGCALCMLGLSTQPPNVHAVQDGLQALERAITLSPGVPLYWRNAAVLFGLAGNNEASQQAWARLRELDPFTVEQIQASGVMPNDCVWEFYFR